MTEALTLNEVAKLLRKSPRWLREWLRDNPRELVIGRYSEGRTHYVVY